MTPDHAHLEKLAREATPGPYFRDMHLGRCVYADGEQVFTAHGGTLQQAQKNAMYAVAIEPAVVLELLRERAELLAIIENSKPLTNGPTLYSATGDLRGN